MTSNCAALGYILYAKHIDVLNKTKETLVPKRERTLLSNTFFQPTNYSANDTLWLYVYDYDYDYD